MDRFEFRKIGYLQVAISLFIFLITLLIDFKYDVVEFMYLAISIHFGYGLGLILISYLMKR